MLNAGLQINEMGEYDVQNYNEMLTLIAGEMQEYARQNGGSIFPVDPVNSQFALFKSRRFPGVFALVFGYNRGIPQTMEISLLVDANYRPLRPDLVRQIEALAPSVLAQFQQEYNGLVVQFETAARQYDYFGMFSVAQQIISLQNRAVAAGLDASLFPIPPYGGK